MDVAGPMATIRPPAITTVRSLWGECTGRIYDNHMGKRELGSEMKWTSRLCVLGAGNAS